MHALTDTTGRTIVQHHARSIAGADCLDCGRPVAHAVHYVSTRTPIGTRILCYRDQSTDQGVITGATSQVILYRSDWDGQTYGVAVWEVEGFVYVLAAPGESAVCAGCGVAIRQDDTTAGWRALHVLDGSGDDAMHHMLADGRIVRHIRGNYVR